MYAVFVHRFSTLDAGRGHSLSTETYDGCSQACHPNAHRFVPRIGPACPLSFPVVSMLEKRNNLQQVSALSPIPARILPFSPTQPALQIFP
jgi:hypothetical protein